MITATVITRFSSAHYLPYHNGKCANAHGHNYKLETTVASLADTTDGITKDTAETGMVMDFSNLKSIINEILDKEYDHAFLNTYISNPTAENMVRTLSNSLIQKLREYNAFLVRLKLWETDNCFVEYDAMEHKAIDCTLGEYL